MRFLSLLLLVAAPRSAVSFAPTAGISLGLEMSRIASSQFRAISHTTIDSKLFSYSDNFSRKDSRILLVDDEEPIRTAVGDFFVAQGYKVTTCADGAQALEVAHSQKPDCVVSDIRMPIMDGLELLEEIRSSELSDTPVVLLSAKAMVQDRIHGYDAGADAYLTKPFSPEELVAIVDNLVQRSRNLRQEKEDLYGTITTSDLLQDLTEIKDLLQNKGGGGIGNGWVRKTNVFLSKDERAVLELISKGKMTKEIASQTHLSTRRIEQLLTGMFRKTGVKNRTELVRWAVSTGNVE